MICRFFFFQDTISQLTTLHQKCNHIHYIFLGKQLGGYKPQKKKKRKEGEYDTNARRCRKCKKFPRDRRRQAEFDSHKADPKQPLIQYATLQLHDCCELFSMPVCGMIGTCSGFYSSYLSIVIQIIFLEHFSIQFIFLKYFPIQFTPHQLATCFWIGNCQHFRNVNMWHA